MTVQYAYICASRYADTSFIISYCVFMVFCKFSMKQCIGVDLKSLLQYLALYFSIVLLFLFCCGVRRGPVVVVRGFRSAGPIDSQSLAALSPYTVYIICTVLSAQK